MGDRERNIVAMFDAIVQFNVEHEADYVAVAAANAQFTVVQNAKDALHALLATQTSGEASEAVVQKSVLRLAIRRKMKQFSHTARALSLTDPGFSELFMVPDSNNDHD